MLAPLLEEEGQLARGGGLARALKADEHDDGHPRGGHGDLALGAPEKLGELVPDDLDDRLVGLQAAEDFLAHGLFPHVRDEIPGDFEIDVCFEQRPAHFAERAVDIAFGEFAPSAQVFKSALQLVS